MPTAIEIKSYITNIDSTYLLDRVNYNTTKNIQQIVIMLDILQLNDMLVPDLKALAEKLDLKAFKGSLSKILSIKYWTTRLSQVRLR